MNPPAPPRSTALVSSGSSAPASTAALSVPTAAPSVAPYASAPWSPSTRGWLVPTAAQQATGALLEDRSRALALAANHAANAVTLHVPRSGASFTAEKRKPARVLEEGDYLGTMSQIIRRDFFPALDAMERKLALHTPAWSGSMSTGPGGARAGAAASTPAATPLTAAALRQRRGQRAEGASFEDTPLPEERPGSPVALEPGTAASSSAAAAAAAASSTAVIPRPPSSAAALAAAQAEADAAASVKLHPHELRLGSYLELHTSEDNASFDAIQTKRQRLLESKRPWANAEFEAKTNDQRIVLADDAKRGGNVSGWKYAVRNKLFFYPEHDGRSELGAEAYGADMTEAEKVAQVMQQKSASIEYENTRFPGALTNPFPGQNSSSKGTPGATTPAAASGAASRTPAVGGYKLLRTPSPMPGAGSDSPQMTWGTVLATPQHLREEDAPDAVGPLSLSLSPDEAAAAAEAAKDLRFKIAPTPTRDEVAWGMVEAARKKELAAKKRRRQDSTPVPLKPELASPALLGYGSARPPLRPGTAGSSGAAAATSASSAPGTPLLSPAAQRLMAATLRAARASPASADGRRVARPAASALSGVDMQLRASYSPSPSALAHGRSGASSSRRNAPAVPLFNATPSPMRLPVTPAHAAR